MAGASSDHQTVVSFTLPRPACRRTLRPSNLTYYVGFASGQYLEWIQAYNFTTMGVDIFFRFQLTATNNNQKIIDCKDTASGQGFFFGQQGTNSALDFGIK